MIKSLFLFFNVCVVITLSHGQVQRTGTQSDTVVTKLREYALDQLQEKVYVITDKPYYAIGDTIWFQTFLVNAINHQPMTLSNTVYVDLAKADGTKVSSRVLLSLRGTAAGDFVLPDNWDPGKYQIQAYTKWMQNGPEEFIFRKTLNVYDVWPDDEGQKFEPKVSESNGNEAFNSGSPKVEIRLFPEGGNLVSGITTTVGLKSTIADSEIPVAVRASVLDASTEQLIANFSTDNEGLGKFVFANPVTQYKIVLDSPYAELKYQMEPVLVGGYSLKVINQRKTQKILVLIETDIPNGLNDGFLIGHTRGETFCNVALGSNAPQAKMLAIHSGLAPSGVAHFTLFDGNGKPRAERLIYIDHGDKLLIPEISSSKKVYKTREEIDLDLVLPDSLYGQTTISVTHAGAIKRDDQSENLFTYLMLNSDIAGSVSKPAQYLTSGDSDMYQKLDDVLLVHGWRRFTWDQVLDTTNYSRIRAETGITYTGRLKNYVVRNKAASGHVQLISMKLNSESILDGLSYTGVDTDEYGEFLFNNLYFEDSVKLIFQAKKSEDKKGFRYFIELDEVLSPEIPEVENAEMSNLGLEVFLNKSNRAYIVEKSYSQDVIVLEALEVEAKAENPFQDAVGGRYMSPDYRLIPDSLYGEGLYLIDILRRIPFIQFDVENMPRIRNQRPYVYFDGFEMDSDLVASLMQGTPSSDIFFVDVDRSGFSNGRGVPIIYIYSKSGNGVPLTVRHGGELPGILQAAHPGYYKAREFYKPYYGEGYTKTPKPDLRLQLYWEPKLEFKDGKASTSFYASDDKGTYDVIVEGMDDNGRVILGKIQIKVE